MHNYRKSFNKIYSRKWTNCLPSVENRLFCSRSAFGRKVAIAFIVFSDIIRTCNEIRTIYRSISRRSKINNRKDELHYEL